MRTTLLKNKKVILIIIICISWFCYNRAIHRFSTEQWVDYPQERVGIVDNLLKKYQLLGITREEVILLLGEETETDYFKTENNMVYYLGQERSLISIDSEWLVLEFQNDCVTEVNIVRD